MAVLIKKRDNWHIVENSTQNGKLVRTYLKALGKCTKTEAKAALTRYNYENEGRPSLRQNRFDFVRDEFLRVYLVTAKPRMIEIFNWATAKFAAIDRLLVSDITTAHIKKIQADMVLSGLSGRSINLACTEIKKVFKFSRDSRYIRELPDLPRFPEIPVNRTIRLSNDDIEKMLEQANDNQRFVLEFMINTGVRPQEFNALLPRHIDLKRGVIRIESNSKFKSGRTIPITPKLRDILEREWEWIESRGKLTAWKHRCGATLAIKRLAKRALGVDINLKALRKTFATILAERGISRAAHTRIMGHSDYRTTDKYYVDVDQDFLRKELEGIGL